MLREGDKAPYTGQLFENNTALRWANWLLQYKFRLKADLAHQKALWDADKGYYVQLLDIEKNKYTQVTVDYQKQVATQQTEILKLQEEVRNPPFFKSVWFGVILGVLVTGAAVGVGLVIAK